MKKITATVLALLLLAAAFTGCTKKGNDVPSDSETDIETPSDDKKEETSDKDTASDDKKEEDSETDEKDNEQTPDDEKKDDTTTDDTPAVMPEEPTKKPDNADDDKKPADDKVTKPVETPEQKPSEPVETPEQKPEETPSQGTTESALSGKSASEIVDMIYEKNPVSDLSLVTDMLSTEDADTLKFIAGITDASLVSEVAYSGPMIGSIPYSMIVVKVKDKNDTATVAQQMKDNINMRRWVCVEADSLTVDGYDDVVMLFMVNEGEYGDLVTTDGMKEAFKSICGGSLDVEL